MHMLSRRGIRVICILLDPRSFGAAGTDPATMRQMIESAGALVYTIRQDDDLTAALSYRTWVHTKPN
jgi:hypothetical protein